MQSEVLIVTQCFYPDAGGIEGLVTALADQCVAAGRTVTVIADRIRSKQAVPPPGKPYTIARFGGPRPWRRWRKKACIASIALERGIGIACIFADSWKSIEALPSGLKTPVSVLAHGMEFPLDASSAKRQRVSAALARCDAVIANSHYTAGLVLPYLAGQTNKLQIVLPPCPPLTEPEPGALAAIQGRISGRHPVVVTVARLEPRKGVDAVIRAMPQVLQRHPGCLYAIAGAGADRPRLEELAKALNLQRAVVFLGRVSDAEKMALLAQADVFAMPVRREGQSVEGFGMSYLEAGWFGVPSLAGRDGGAADAVLDGETGLVCDGTNPGEVTRSLLALLDDEVFRKRIGTAAQQRSKHDLSWPMAIERYLASFNPAGRSLRA